MMTRFMITRFMMMTLMITEFVINELVMTVFVVSNASPTEEPTVKCILYPLGVVIHPKRPAAKACTRKSVCEQTLIRYHELSI